MERFLFFLTESGGMSENTIASYKRDLKKFFDYLNLKDMKPETICQSDIEDFIEYMDNNDYSEASVARMICTLRKFFSFLCERGEMGETPMQNIHKSKPKRSLPLILTGAEIDLISEALKKGGMKRCRDRAIFELLYSTGIKVSEIIELKIENVNTDIGFLSCGEGENSRLIPIYSYASDCVREYIEKVRPKLIQDEKSDILFLNCSGGKLTRQGLWKITKQFGKISGVRKVITPHIIRHTFAADLLGSGAKLSDVKERLGHTDLSATYIYEEIFKNRIKDVYKTRHPRVKMRYY